MKRLRYFILLLIAELFVGSLLMISLWDALFYIPIAVSAIVAGLLIWLSSALTGWIPVIGAVIGWILGIASSIVEIYVIAGIIVSILRKLDIIK